MPVCITGMHRNGTSMVAHLLKLCGLHLGPEDEMLPTSPANPGGYREFKAIVGLNDDILAARDGSRDNPTVSTPLDRVQAEVPAELRSKAEAIINQFAGETPWGWQDTRNNLTLPFWQTYLKDIKVVVCLHPPLDSIRPHARGETVTEGYKTWDLYYKQLRSNLGDLPFIVTHYESYFRDAPAELRRVTDFLDLPANEETIAAACQIINVNLRRHPTLDVELIGSEVPPEIVAHYFEWRRQAGPVYQKYMEEDNSQLPAYLGKVDLDTPDVNQIFSARYLLAQEQLADAQRRLADSEQQVQTLSAELSQYERTVQKQVSELARFRQEVDVSRARLASIYQTRSWQLISNWWQFKARYMPKDSPQLRAYYLLRTSAHTIAQGGWKAFFERTGLWLRGERRYHNGGTQPGGRQLATGHLTAAASRPALSDGANNVVQQRFEEAFFGGGAEFVIHPVADPAYAAHVVNTEPHLDELRRQVKQAEKLTNSPVFSVIMTVTGQPQPVLAETIASLQTQTYQNWVGFLVEAGCDKVVRQQLAKSTTQDTRFKLIRAGDGQTISGVVNEALKQAAGDYVIFVDAGDTLAPHALYSLASRLKDQPDIDLIYTDVDRLNDRGYRSAPLFKPSQWSPELLLSINYLDNLGAFRRSLLEKTGTLNFELDQGFRWDLFLRLSEVAKHIEHLPQVLYHQRANSGPPTGSTQIQPHTLTAIRDHLTRTGAIAAVVSINENQDTAVRWSGQPQKRISIIIPSRDNPRYLERCLESIFELTTYPDFEVLVVDNNSVLPETHRLYQRFETDPRFRLVPFNEPFNFSRACNRGVQQAEGSLLLFLNNDTQVLQGDWLALMAQWFERDKVGAVGPKLLFDDGAIQHAGVVLGFGSSCSHIFMGNQENTQTMYGSDNWYRNYLAVTGACLMISRQALDQVKGWNEDYQVMFSDVDLCLEIHQAGYRIVYTPDVRLKHFAHATNAEQFPRNDYVLVAERWARYLTDGDPYFNPNLSVSGDVSQPSFILGPEEPPLHRLQALLERTRDMQFIKHRRVMVVSGDVLPLEGLPTTGAGLRAWGIGQGLKARGFEVLFAMTEEIASSVNYKVNRSDVLVFDPAQFQEIVNQLRPDVLIFQHWPLARLLHRPYPHTVIDLHGPLMLESLFRIGEETRDLYQQKLEALSLADYFTCAGERQRNYFYAWLSMAGLDLRETPIEVVPFSLSPETPCHDYPNELSFVYGGVFLPWQNPILGLRVLLEELDASNTGHLNFYGGKHPWVKMSGHEFERVKQLLLSSTRATVMPTVPRDELIQHYQNASVAWDLMSHNSERGMAFTSRTVEYLWTGLPVVYNDYAELSQYIEQYEAGWTVNPDDELAIRRVVQEIIQNPDEIKRRGANAQRLVTEVLNWETAVEPLDRFISNPHRARRLFETPILVDPAIR